MTTGEPQFGPHAGRFSWAQSHGAKAVPCLALKKTTEGT